VKRTFKRFAGSSSSGRFRQDGKVLVCADAETVKVFDSERGTQLRALKGHSSVVNATRFSAPHPLRLVSAGNDKTVRLWDLTSASTLATCEGHTDYVRCVSESSQGHGSIWASGSYDHTVRIWDVRDSKNTSCTMTLNHEEPVDAVVHFGGGGLVASAGGPSIKIWDLASGGRLLHTLENHQKSVTGLCLDSTGRRLLSCGADGQLKIYDTESFKVCHSLKYSSQLLSVALSPNGRTLAAGTVSGELVLRTRRVQENNSAATATVSRAKRGIRGTDNEEVEIVTSKRKRKMRPHDLMLKKFQYRDALDTVLETRDPVQTMAVIDELIYRNGLEIALQQRKDSVELIPLLKFLVKYTSDPKYSKILLQVCNDVLDIYAPILGKNVRVDELFFQLQHRVALEVQMQTKLAPLKGSIDSLLAASLSSS
jgi:U3 small nucleolar RNA-associated protein 15